MPQTLFADEYITSFDRDDVETYLVTIRQSPAAQLAE